MTMGSAMVIINGRGRGIEYTKSLPPTVFSSSNCDPRLDATLRIQKTDTSPGHLVPKYISGIQGSTDLESWARVYHLEVTATGKGPVVKGFSENYC